MISLQDFLKTYSSISNKFINDFFPLHTINTYNDDLIIDFDNYLNG
jgi:hypothetical protein